jgi:rare lipoprotein A
MTRALLVFFCVAASACAVGGARPVSPGASPTAATPKPEAGPKSAGPALVGQASYYADKFHGRKTASGERYNKKALTCAHRSLPFGTRLRVENLTNGKIVEVKVNDRGPYSRGRLIDVSRAAAERLGFIRAGTARVKVTVLSD